MRVSLAWRFRNASHTSAHEIRFVYGFGYGKFLRKVRDCEFGFGESRAGLARGRPGIGLRPDFLRQLTIRSSRTRFVAAPCAFRYASAKLSPLRGAA